ncbi:MAG: tRNA (adenosine(37)-N6)-threonylcarbamoyltransferase complex dimerization subunit type 1 TsaB [Acidimicrobiales bacterium]
MLILGIESATQQVGCAIGGHEGVLASAHSCRARRHAETLAPQIDFVRTQARVDLSEISVVAVDLGPGLYTGLRVGIATATAMAYALGVPMIGVPSLDLVAHPVRFTNRLIVAALDARRGEVFYAFYRQVPGGVQRVTGHRVASPEDLASELVASGEEILLVGDGALRHSDVFEGIARVEIAEQGLAYPTAGSLVQLAHARALREDFVKPWELRPLYLRLPDAEPDAWATRNAP